MDKSMNAESLLNIPLVRQLLSDRTVRLEPRAIDSTWFHERALPIATTGFNPFAGAIYYNARSPFARWLADPTVSGRLLNEGDFLIRDVLFAVHDYLHIWCAAQIRELCPELGYGTAPLSPADIERFAYCHLVTEAAATCGLDYWYLSTILLDDVVRIGTQVEGLTVRYHERHLEEYRRFHPEFLVQTPEFFVTLCEFYAGGAFPGFDVEDLRKSPRILGWLRHELTYGVKQREYVRMWLSYLAHGRIDLTPEQLRAPVDCSAPWQARLAREIGERLWRKVKCDRLEESAARLDPERAWRSRLDDAPDFRFVNVNRVDVEAVESIARAANAEENFRYFAYQYLSSFEYATFDRDLLALVDAIARKRDSPLLVRLLRNQKRLAPIASEPRDLLILN